MLNGKKYGHGIKLLEDVYRDTEIKSMIPATLELDTNVINDSPPV